MFLEAVLELWPALHAVIEGARVMAMTNAVWPPYLELRRAVEALEAMEKETEPR